MTDTGNKPLLGDLRVIELATMVFAPSACVVMADFGAEVIKVEPPQGGDLNRNKKSVALDLKSEAGYAAFCKLLADADVMVTNYRLKALERLRLDYETVRQISEVRRIWMLSAAYITY